MKEHSTFSKVTVLSKHTGLGEFLKNKHLPLSRSQVFITVSNSIFSQPSLCLE